MMATVPHVTSGSGLRKFQADGFLFDGVYILCVYMSLYVCMHACIYVCMYDILRAIDSKDERPL